MSKNVLFITEGKNDTRFLKALLNTFRDGREYEVFVYNTSIHELLERLMSETGMDDDVDFMMFLKGCNTNKEQYELLDRKFTDIFLIFDMDPHHQRYDPERLKAAMEFFSDSTVNGKLYLNYPMLESFRHIPDPEGFGYLDDVRGLCRHPKCVAVGEIGLDYHYSYDEKELQHKVFREQMALAREIGKPVIVHDREATQDVLGIIADYPDVRGVMHCFSGSWETAKTILDLGWSISFTGVVTFKNARRAVEVAQKIPLDRIMIETDSPYMAPEPVRGTRNDSRNVRYICRKIASLRGMSEEEFAAVTMENGKRFFGIK